ncbi:MAG: transglutaminase domain-containing protein [Catonella sp.]|uniref:transglutaminase domain-containing protein n=1 Tax=Catonella sp. TaxID=2382125 RepID=UPI003F9F71D4
MKRIYHKLIYFLLILIISSFLLPSTVFKPNILTATTDSTKKHIIKSKKELIKAMRLHVERLDKNFSLNIDKKVLNVNNKKQYDAFWNYLYEIPEFNDVCRYFKNFNAFQTEYQNYYEWTIKTNYDITKKELRRLNKFVADWTEENISSDMTDEEKVRAINDFMVGEYRYTFGDKGPCKNKNCTEEKLGKYSVYTTFSLIYCKGGVCDAKAKLFYRLAKKAGLEVLYVTGYVNKTTLHAWNMVKVDGNWYHVDNTWNRSSEVGMNEYQYIMIRDYYLKGDVSMKKGHHSWKSGKYPAAPKDYPLNNID